MTTDRNKTNWTLFQKYMLALFAAVVIPLLAGGITEAWFGYRDQRARLDELLALEAKSAATKIQGFVDGITSQLEWLLQLSWTEGADERRRTDALRLLHQVPAIISLTLVDGSGRERLYVSRVGLNRVESRAERSSDPPVQGARSAKIWYSRVEYHEGSEPYLVIALSGNRPSVGIVVAEINLKLIWDVISGIKIGEAGYAFLLDEPGNLIGHPDINLVLRGADEAQSYQGIRAAALAARGSIATGEDAQGQTIAAAAAAIPGPNWTVVVQQPLSEAFSPIYAALRRTGSLLLVGSVLASLIAFAMARHMSGPIRLLEQGTQRIGAGDFSHRIEISTGDELQRLASSFNTMAAELALSREREERIAKLKQFLAPQVAELVDRLGDDSVLEGRRTDVVAAFCDLRGFTAFAIRATPEEVISVLSEYYEALGRIVTRYEATLTSFSGDGLMVLINAPVPIAEPSLRAIDMAVDMQANVQQLVRDWRARNYQIGFGVGLALGPAIVGRIGYESRSDYTAIGSVVNLASRLCSSAADGEILADASLAEAVHGKRFPIPLGTRYVKGYDRELAVFRFPFGESACQGTPTAHSNTSAPKGEAAGKVEHTLNEEERKSRS